MTLPSSSHTQTAGENGLSPRDGVRPSEGM